MQGWFSLPELTSGLKSCNMRQDKSEGQPGEIRTAPSIKNGWTKNLTYTTQTFYQGGYHEQ
jgi:hypothetical protein